MMFNTMVNNSQNTAKTMLLTIAVTDLHSISLLEILEAIWSYAGSGFPGNSPLKKTGSGNLYKGLQCGKSQLFDS